MSALSALALVALCGAFVGPLVFRVPPYMDELVQYHGIACREFPLAVHNVLRAPCDGSLDLRVAGTWLPLRSYPYLGITASLLYYPLYLAFPDPVSARLLGALCLGLFTCGLARLTRMRAGHAIALGALCLPIAAQMIVDTGPVRVHLLVVVWGALAVRWLLGQTKVSAAALAVALALGVGLFLGVEQKAIFLLLLPGIVLLGFVATWLDDDRDARTLPAIARSAVLLLLPALALTATLSLLLLSAKTREGATYGSLLATAGRRLGVLDGGAQFAHFRDHLAHPLRDLTIFGASGLVPAARSFSAWTEVWWLALLVGFPLCAIGIRRRAFAAAAACVALFVVTLWAINLQARSWAGHHLVLAWPYLLTGAGILLREIDRRGTSRRALVLLLLAAVVASQLALQREVLERPIHPFSSPDRDAIHTYLDDSGLSRRSVIVVLDWGSYYVKSLYGPRDQLVVYAEPLRRPFDVEHLRELAARLGRQLAFVARRGSRADLGRLRTEFPGLVRVDVPGARGRAEWELWVAEAGHPG